MTKVFGEEPGAGVFVYFEGEPARRRKLCLALVEDAVNVLGLAEDEVRLAVTKTLNYFRTYSLSALDKAITNPELEKFRILVGEHDNGQLGAEMLIRHAKWTLVEYPDPGWQRLRAPGIWLLARCSRWSATQIRELAYRWFHTAAKLGRPVSGGATWNPLTEDLRNELAMDWSTSTVPEWQTFPVERELFRAFLQGDKEERTHDRIRRLYPVSLLGPRFATPRNVELLRAAGADVEEVKGSLIVTTSPTLEQVWTPEYLAKTAALRKLAWPISIQNPIDYEGLGREHGFRMNPRTSLPQHPTPEELRTAMTAFRAAVATLMPAVVSDDALEFAPDCQASPLPPAQRTVDFSEDLSWR